MATLAEAQAMFPDRLVTNAWKGLGDNLHVYFADGGDIEINTNEEANRADA